MHKFFVSNNLIDGDKAVIEGDDVKHIYKVLRLQVGDEIIINNLNGQEYLARIEDISKKEVQASIIEKIDISNESPIRIHLYQGLPKSTKMDLIVQKGTELGISSITPVITERVVVKNEGEFKKVDRWQRIALEASKQSKRTLIPAINTPISFEAMMEKMNSMDLIVVPYENAEGYGIKNMVKDLKIDSITDIAIVIGPEGGFEEDEISKLKDMGAHIVTLGPRILRTESAGFVCTAILQYELGDVGGVI
ncbi:MAG: 16S rRNA (uracil(1498)-N(3))-methyltransferase [Clostridium sp.]|uniref:16S rRNA (uracil(1498)-N(3))-methyltransferase n=1 Tax=Clostridium sp. TaxID=1506 RepID=UPI002A86A548|nr:16S rRNA (uracil(1498)-N(3))-methyltransferase [Clostridium sp.]MDY5097874.1 16S rRNA (uracil(1498)-N(3))-methyltransferase [Clostridium sp.]